MNTIKQYILPLFLYWFNRGAYWERFRPAMVNTGTEHIKMAFVRTSAKPRGNSKQRRQYIRTLLRKCGYNGREYVAAARAEFFWQ